MCRCHIVPFRRFQQFEGEKTSCSCIVFIVTFLPIPLLEHVLHWRHPKNEWTMKDKLVKGDFKTTDDVLMARKMRLSPASYIAPIPQISTWPARDIAPQQMSSVHPSSQHVYHTLERSVRSLGYETTVRSISSIMGSYQHLFKVHHIVVVLSMHLKAIT